MFRSLNAFAGPYDDFECKFNDRAEAARVEFKLSGEYEVKDETHATLTYDASLEFLDQEWNNNTGHSFVFGHAKSQKGLPHHGRKYKDHFKFEIQCHGVDSSIEYGDLILSRLPASTTQDQYGATIETFTGVLDVRYNDHHGDFVWVKCTRRSFPR